MQEWVSLEIIARSEKEANAIADCIRDYCNNSLEDRFSVWGNAIETRGNIVRNDGETKMYHFDLEDLQADLFESIVEQLPDVEFEGGCEYNNDDGDLELGFHKKYFEGVLMETLKKGKLKIISCRKDFSGDYIIPDEVTQICDGAFEGCENLKWVYIPESVKKIGKNTFKGCKNLREVHISEGVEKIIGKSVFAGCDNLTIYAPEGSCAETYAKNNKIPFIAE